MHPQSRNSKDKDNDNAQGGQNVNDPATTPVTPENAITRHLQHIALEGKSPTTITARAGALRRAEASLAAGGLLADAAPAQLLPWRLSLSSASVNYVLAQVSHVRCFFAWLLEEEYRHDNPARRLPVPRKPFAVPHPIGEAELRVAIDRAPDRIRLWLILAAYCGLRACEIAGLLRRSIREHDRDPHIFISAESAKGGYEAVIPLRGYALEQVRATRLPARGWAFPRMDGLPGHLTAHRVCHLCNDYLHSLGYPDTLHSLRHYFGTETQRATGNARTTMRALRHRRLDTTAIYTLVTDDEVAAALAAIPAPRRLRAAS